MITKVVLGWRPGGLIAYLMGPGRAEEHQCPRVIASWDGLDTAWQPPRTDTGSWDLDLGPLVSALRAPAVAAGLPDRPDNGGKRGYVWHCSARLAPRDRVLSDGEWAGIARELLDGAGVAARDDPGGPRWFAVRHADDHIHVAVVLVRQDTCRRFWPFQEYPRLRETARVIEGRLGLTATAAADGTAAPALTRGEREKAQREGREPARVELSRVVREAAAGSDGPVEFVSVLTRAGYLVELRRATSGDPLGYKVARRGDVTAAGVPVFYSGSKLAPDLSLPRLMRTWGGAGRECDVPEPMAAARRRVDAARRVVRAARRGQALEDPAGVAHAAHSVLTALRGTSAEWAGAADQYDRAARAPRGARVREGARAAGLRRIARQLARQRRLLGGPDEPGAAAVALAVALAALLREIAAWHRDRGRVHQSVAAFSAVDALDRVADGRGTSSIGGLRIVAPAVTTQRPRVEPRHSPTATAPTTAHMGLR